MHIDFDELGLRIKKRRRELGLKQNELAEMMKISNNYLSNIENGHSIPSLEVTALYTSIASSTLLLTSKLTSSNLGTTSDNLYISMTKIQKKRKCFVSDKLRLY